MNIKKNIVPCMVIMAGLFVSLQPAAAAPRGMDYGDPQLDPVFTELPDNVETLRLENGLEVVLMANPAQPMAGIYTQVKVGSAREDYRTSGMSHMLEHLLFNGTEKYDQDQLYELADQVGAYNNANTTDFYTNYMLVVPAQDVETGFEIQSQMLFHSLIPAEKFDKEKGIVLGEIVQSRDWPGTVTNTILRQALFAGTSLELPTLGTRSTIEHMDRDDVHAFYKHWYVPNNMVLTVAGNFDRDEVLEWLEEYYGSIAPGTMDRTGLRPVDLIDRTTSVVRRGGDKRVLALSFDAPSYGMQEYFPFLVMSELLGLEGSGILTRALGDLPAEERPDLGVWWEQAPGFGRLNLEFDLTAGGDPQTMFQLVQDAAAAAIEMGIEQEDILGIVRMSETHTLLEREQLRMTGIYIADPLVQGGVDFFLSYLDRMRQVTADDVAASLSSWLLDAPCRAVLIEPDADAAPGGGMMGMGHGMPSGMTMPGTAPKDGTMAEPEPEPEVQLVVDRTVLPSGAVLVSQTNPESELVAIHLTVRGRARIDQEYASAGAVDVVHRLLEEGFSGCDRTCLARRLRSLGAVVKIVDDPRIPMDNYYTNGYFSFIRIETAAEFTAEILEMLTEEIRFAAFDEGDFDRIVAERIAELGRQKASARRTADRMVAETLYQGHPLSLPAEGDPETLGTVDFNQARAVYRNAFAPQNLIFSVVGPLSHDQLRSSLESLLPGKAQPSAGLPPAPVTEVAQLLTGSVGGQMSAIRLASVVAIDPADAAALELAIAVLSDRIVMDLREERGLSYSVGASVFPHGNRARFTAWINPPAERREEALTALQELIAGFDPATITQEEMDKIRSARTGRMMMRRLSSMGQAYYLAMAELEGDIAAYLGGLQAYDGLTLADLGSAVDRYLDGANLVEVVVE